MNNEFITDIVTSQKYILVRTRCGHEVIDHVYSKTFPGVTINRYTDKGLIKTVFCVLPSGESVEKRYRKDSRSIRKISFKGDRVISDLLEYYRNRKTLRIYNEQGFTVTEMYFPCGALWKRFIDEEGFEKAEHEYNEIGTCIRGPEEGIGEMPKGVKYLRDFREDSRLLEIMRFVDGLRDGRSYEYSDKGLIKETQFYHKGVLQGTISVNRLDDGTIHEQVIMQSAGKLNGPKVDISPKALEYLGTIPVAGYVKKTIFRKNGMKESEVFFVRTENAPDFRHGEEKRYDKKGTLTKTTYYVQGMSVASKFYLHPEMILPENIVDEANANRRRVLIQMMGYARFLIKSRSVLLHKDGDYELRRIHLVLADEPILLLKVKCASTGMYYVLRVPPIMQTCSQAVAWTFGMSPSDYVLEEET